MNTTAAVAVSEPISRAAPSRWRPSLSRSRKWALWGAYAGLILFAVFFLIPPYYMLVTSLKTSQQIAAIEGNPWALPWPPTVSNWLALFTDTQFPIFFRNSVIATICTVAISMAISILAAFSLSRMRFWGSATLATGVFLCYLIPETLLFIPLFQVVGFLGLMDSMWVMVLVFPTLSVPFCTWIMIGYFQSIPKELDEAALIDGASRMQLLLKIFIPVAMPGIIAATIFAFTVSWAGFLYPLAYIFSFDQMPLTVGIASTMIKADVFQWHMIMSAALLAALPPLVVYAFLMDYYIAGLTAGATKG
ncbi:carbohydrate ABC transporter permease [Elioraea sp.]|jgi:multiple sugar transport system permease protein|uniref:carbohydrate ABC transporter permease n=1 Tax=Elioraea sp. TaxID=2185103 RepID=UPI0021DECB68|nr:carbohydrate ABC transporter permease [Elioraea sp.]GIX11339.1 MAG: ABC transporter permease [Elioraea sp.]